MPNIKDLPFSSQHWGTFRVETAEGKIKQLHPFDEDSDPSPIMDGMLDTIHAKNRIQKPAIRKSWLEKGYGANPELRGVEPFVEVDWETAEQIVADELQRVINTHGNEALYAGSYGWASAGRFHHAQSQIHRFFNCIGGYTRSVNSYSLAAAEVILPHVMGDIYEFLAQGTSWQSVIESGELVVAFGGMAIKNGQINNGGVGKHIQRESFNAAKKAGVEFVNISPMRDDVMEHLNAQWLPARPNTDTAILLAIAHTLYTEDLHDQSFLDRYSVGFEKFLPYLLGQTDGVAKDVTWASEITKIDAESIRQLARRMAKQRTIISISWSLTRQDNGEQPYWAAVTVAAMLGQIGLPGGGIAFGYSASNSIGIHNTKLPGAALPQGENKVKSFIPVARISDALLNPGKEYIYNGQKLTYPDIKTVYWAGGNPFHHHQDLNRLLQAWRKPESIIVHEWCWNSTAKHADIVLPCTVTLERNDIGFSPRDGYLIDMQQALQPYADARNDYDILANIADKLDAKQSFTKGRDEQQWLEWIYQKTEEKCLDAGINIPSYDQLKEQGWYRPAPPEKPVVLVESFRENPEQNPLNTPSGKIEIFSETIAAYGDPDIYGHAVWHEPREWLGNASASLPLHLLGTQPASKLHSHLDHGSHSRKAKIQDREMLIMHTNDADERGLKDGDIVRVFNDRGACLAGVKTNSQLLKNVVQMPTGSWFDPEQPGVIGSFCKHGNVNILTPDRGTSKLAQGPAAHTCLVQVEKYLDEAPEVTAFEPPVLLNK